MRLKLKKLQVLFLKKKLRFAIVLVITVILFLSEFIISIVSKSVALSADAGFMIADIIATTIALLVVIRSRKPTLRSTFGYVRAEIIATLLNSVLLSALCFEMIKQSISRILKPDKLKHINMIISVSSIGLIINIINIFIIKYLPMFITTNVNSSTFSRAVDIKKEESTNGMYESHCSSSSSIHSICDNESKVEANSDTLSLNGGENKALRNKISEHRKSYGLIINFAADLLGSLTTLISALISKYYGDRSWTVYIDPSLTICISLMVIVSGICAIRKSAFLLMEVVPKQICIKTIIDDIMTNIPQIEQIHDIHIWQLVNKRMLATMHVIVKSISDEADYMNILSTLSKLIST
ncbi:hypothetical protein GJ496_011804 [Pomphorhynchus laevis]|nr:hypothetical protein GJ496_011804 [Pomphorhynchus laevis]